MRNNFESAVAHLLPSCPVARKRAVNPKRGAAEISAMNENEQSADISAFGTKPGRGKTGVHFQYHTHKEFIKLSKEQKNELIQWRASQADGKKGNNAAKASKMKDNKDKKVKFDDKAMAAAVDTRVEAKFKEIVDEQKTEDDVKAYIMGCLKEISSGKSSATKVTTASTAPPSSSASLVLKNIIKRAKNT